MGEGKWCWICNLGSSYVIPYFVASLWGRPCSYEEEGAGELLLDRNQAMVVLSLWDGMHRILCTYIGLIRCTNLNTAWMMEFFSNQFPFDNFPFFLFSIFYNINFPQCSRPSYYLSSMPCFLSIYFFSWPPEPISNSVQRPNRRADAHTYISRQRSL